MVIPSNEPVPIKELPILFIVLVVLELGVVLLLLNTRSAHYLRICAICSIAYSLK